MRLVAHERDDASRAGRPARIVNEVKRINRVVYDLTSKPPGNVEWA